jgi:hypothetical protein
VKIPMRNHESTKFEKPNYSNARGKAAVLSNGGKNEQENPDVNPGNVQESSRPEMGGQSGGWDKGVTRKQVVKPIDTNQFKPIIEPHGIKRV